MEEGFSQRVEIFVSELQECLEQLKIFLQFTYTMSIGNEKQKKRQELELKLSRQLFCLFVYSVHNRLTYIS